jgi:hypothetical protein
VQNRFSPQFKALLRQDHPQNEGDVHGDYLSFVDTYISFIEEIHANALATSKRAKLLTRFVSTAQFTAHITSGVHHHIMRRIYRDTCQTMG